MNTRRRLGLAVAMVTVFTLATSLAAQTPFIPYFGKNSPRYDRFEWWTYETDHFLIYYYPDIEPHLERMAGYAESAYQHVSSELKYDLAHKVPLILFQTSSEFQQQNVVPGAAQEGVGAFAEPTRQRIVMPMDEPHDLLYRLIVHELTHQFEYDMIPTSLVRRAVPLWVNEGLSDYMTGIWRPQDLMAVRDAAISDIIPKMSKLEGASELNARMVYNLGHAVFQFIEARWGKEGLRQYLFNLRKAAATGGDEAYQESFQISADDFDSQFDKYLKDLFKPFRDRERPADYGRNLAPDPERTRFRNAYSVEPSPTGELFAVATGNGSDREMDIVLVSAKDGKVIPDGNLTNGFDQDRGFEYLVTPGDRWVTVPWMSWSADDRLAYLVRAEKSRALIIQNTTTKRIEQRIDLRTVDDPESPDISPDGRRVAFAALQGGTGDIFIVDLATKDITNVTKDEFADSAPTWSPDGKSIIYIARVSQNEKLFRLDLDSGKKTQITFGTHDDGTAKFIDDDTIVFASTATDPAKPIDPEIARNGNIYNIWTLGLKTGELRQYTDAMGGNLYAVVVNDGGSRSKIGFISYYKAGYELHTIERSEQPITKAASADFGEPGAIIPFQAPLSHTLIADKKKKKGTFEKLFLDGRPPVNVGVTSGGDIFGGSSVTFSDVLGDQQFNLYAASISQYRTLSFSYLNLARRFNYALQAFSQTTFFYGNLGNVFYDQSFVFDRDQALATRTIRGGTVFGIWPFNRYRRAELFAGFMQYREEFNDPTLQEFSDQYQQEQFGRQLFRSGNFVPLGVNYVEETTVFREFGPLAGRTMRIGYEYAPAMGETLARKTVDADVRQYIRLGSSGLLALRARGFRSWGAQSEFMYFGGNSEMHGYDYLSFIGDRVGFFNAELRFPFIEAMLTPLGVLGGIRGVLFANMGGGSFGESTDPATAGQPFRWGSTKEEVYTPIVGFNEISAVERLPIFGEPTVVKGLRLIDARASYGIGLETFALGFPVHFDWSWRTLLNKDWEDLRFAAVGGSDTFRKPKFSVWIGYDF